MSENELILYQSPDGKTNLQLRTEDGSIWLTQLEIAELFSSTKQNISLHINNILKEGELTPNSVVKESLTTARDGKKYRTKRYDQFDTNRRLQEAQQADVADLAELEQLEKQLEQKGRKA